MPTPRIYTDQQLVPGREAELGSGPSRHLVRVLRLETGAGIRLFNGDGFDYSAELLKPDQRAARVLVVAAGDEEPRTPLAIHLGIGISKGDRMDTVVQKSVELGVESICPLFCDRSVVQLKGERLARRVVHWRNVAIAACEQSGRRRIPGVRSPETLTAWVRETALAGRSRLMMHPESRRSLADLGQPGNSVALLIGPEGGFTEAETALSGENGFDGIRLGPRVLRTETAPLAAIAAIQTLWGDLR